MPKVVKKIVDKHNTLKILLVIFLLAVFVRLALPFAKETFYLHKSFVHYGNELLRSNLSDSLLYNYTAKSIIEGHGYAINLKEMYGNEEVKDGLVLAKSDNGYFKHKIVPPVYPFFLALFYFVFGVSTFSYFLPQVVLSSLTCCFIYLIADKIFDNEKLSLLAGLMSVLYLDLIFWSYMVRTESLFIFLLALLFWLLLERNYNKHIYFAVAAGITVGLICLTRITFVFFIPVIMLWQYFNFVGRDKSKLFVLLAFIVSLAIILLPWAIRNNTIFNSFTVITDETGTIFLDYAKDRVSVFQPVTNFASSSYIRPFIDFIQNNPCEFSMKSLRRFITYLSPFTAVNNDLAKVYKGLTWVLIFPAAFWGILLSFKKTWPRSGLLILFILYYILLHSATFVDTGLVYRYPIQPFMCIFAAYGFWYIHSRILGKEG